MEHVKNTSLTKQDTPSGFVECPWCYDKIANTEVAHEVHLHYICKGEKQEERMQYSQDEH